MGIDDEDYICMNYKEGKCPCRCSWADCKDFVPSTYMKDSIETYMEGSEYGVPTEEERREIEKKYPTTFSPKEGS